MISHKNLYLILNKLDKYCLHNTNFYTPHVEINSTIFKTINGDLKVFNKTLISTKDNLKALETVNATVYNKNGAFNLQGLSVNTSQSVSNFTKLNNAFTAYNGNLSKSTQLQNAYIQAVGKQNTSLGNYLAGLNGAKASMGGYIKSLIGAKMASIGLQAASLALNAAISMGLSLTISALVSAITKWANKEKEAREETIENAKAAKEESNNLSELLNKYNQLSKEVKSNQGVKEDLLDVQSDLLDALGIEASQIDTLIEKYGDLDTAINQVTLDSLREAQGDLMTAVDAYEGDLIDVGKGYAHFYSLFDRNILSGGKDSVKAFDILEKSGVISPGSHGTGGGSLVLTGNDKTVEGILENYQKLKDAQEALNTAVDNGKVTMEEMTANPLYKAINKRLDELDESIGNYNTAVDDLNKNIAQQQVLKSLSEQSSIPETQEEFEAFKQSMIDTAVASTKFVGSQDDIRDSIINVLSTMPEFEKFFDEIKFKSETFNNKTDILSISDTIDQLDNKLKPSMDSLKSAWQDIFTEDEFSLDNLDLLSTVDSIKSKLDELNKIDGITVDYSSFEDFVRILEDTESTEDDVKQGFNELAKSIVQASVSGIEDFQTLKDVLEDLGVVNNEIVAFQALAQNTDALKASGLDLLNATQSDIEAFASKRVSIENLSEAIIYLTEQQKYLQFQTEFNSFQNMDTSQEIANLKNLAKNAGITGDVISDLTELEQIYQAVASGVYGINTQQVAMAMERAKQLKNKIQEEISKENLKTPEIEFPEVKFEPKIDKSSAKKSADDLEKLTKDYVDAYMNYMEQSLKTGRIDYQTYARDVAKFLKDMYDQGKIAAKDYHDYTKQMLEVQKNVYDKALSAITRRLEKESEYYQGLIDEINKKNDSLEKQKDDYDSILSVVEKVYDKEIEALQEQQKAIDEKIDALRDANDEEERGIALANARYALEKAQQQRIGLVYTEGEGFIYKQDNEAIREARKELKDVELENTISQLEKEKEALDADIENLEKYKDLWSEIPDLHQQAVNEKLAIDMFGADYEKVILQSREQAINEFANKYISIQQQVDDNNSLIESYEEKKEYYDKLREQWNDLADVYEQSVEDQYAAMLYGVDWEDQILSGRIDYLNDFKDSYIEIQQAIVDAAWNSANEQVKAAKEAAKGADGNTNDITSLGLKKELDKNVEPNSKFNVTYGTTNPSEFEQKLNDVKKYGSLVVVESKKNNNNTNKLDEYYEKLKRGSKYASGTKNAKKGLNLVGEEGTETFVDNDGNVSLVTEPTLIPMKGGETVIKASETEKILTGIDNLVPLNWDEMWNKIKISPQAMPKFDLNIPDYSKMLSNAKSQDVSITQHIELTLPNVTNTSGVENVIETIRKLPLDALQYVNRR